MIQLIYFFLHQIDHRGKDSDSISELMYLQEFAGPLCCEHRMISVLLSAYRTYYTTAN